MSFYRTYRPQTIDQIDNASVRAQLLSLLSKKITDLPHAYFFEGPKGAGKTTAARIIAKLFLCEHLSASGPCGDCPACTSIAEGSHIDVLEIDAASNRGIDDVRELRDRIKLSPAIGKFKVFIIDEVHMMTTEAFNALLKTLEEPPAHAVFVLATTDPQKVPVTVRSRCMEISFGKAKQDELLSALMRIVKKEKIAITDDAVQAIADIADGAFRDAVKLLEQVSFIQGKITTEKVLHCISKSNKPKREEFLASIFVAKDAKKALDAIEAFVTDGSDMKTLLADCLKDLQDALIAQIKEEPTKKTETWDQKDIMHLSKLFLTAYEELRFSTIPQLPIELAVLDFLESFSATPASSSVLPVPQPPTGLTSSGIQSSEVKPSVSVSRNSPTSEEGEATPQQSDPQTDSSEHLNIEKLTSHWADFIEALKPYNHSVAGVIRGARPKSVDNGVVRIEAFYKFHQERLSDPRVRDILTSVLKKLFGVKVRVEIVLGKK